MKDIACLKYKNIEEDFIVVQKRENAIHIKGLIKDLLLFLSIMK